MEDDSEILIKDEEENGTRKSFSDRGGDVEQASYGGKQNRSNIKSNELNA